MKFLYRLIKYHIHYRVVSDWQDSLIWCPSQCSLNFTIYDKEFEIYLRWRWSDPWTGALHIDNPPTWENSKRLELKFWTDEDDLNKIKKDAIRKAKWLIIKEGLI